MTAQFVYMLDNYNVPVKVSLKDNPDAHPITEMMENFEVFAGCDIYSFSYDYDEPPDWKCYTHNRWADECRWSDFQYQAEGADDLQAEQMYGKVGA